MSFNFYDDSPCHDCDRPWKCVNCHSGCPVYMAWEYQHGEKLAEFKKEKDAINSARSQRNESAYKAFRKKGMK